MCIKGEKKIDSKRSACRRGRVSCAIEWEYEEGKREIVRTRERERERGGGAGNVKTKKDTRPTIKHYI